MKRIGKVLALAAIAAMSLTAAVESGHAYSYSAWVGMTGANTIAINPFFGGDFAGNVFTQADVVLEYGISDYADIFTSINGWGMVRYDFSKGNNVGIGALYLDSEQIGLQYHMIKSFADIFTLEANVDVFMPYADMIGTMSFAAYIAPVVTLGKVAFYCEIDPSYALGADGGFGLTIVPGIWLKAGNGEFSLGFPISGLTDGSVEVGYGAWYWIPFAIPTAAAEEAPAEETAGEGM